MRPCGILLSVMVVTRICNNPVYKPPPHALLPNVSMHAQRGGGGGRNLEDSILLWYVNVAVWYSVALSSINSNF